MKNYIFATTARSDLSYVLSIIDYLVDNNFKHNIKLLATGTHFDKNIGYTIDEVKKYKRVPIIELDPYKSNRYSEVSASGNILLGLDSLDLKIDVMLILGDRYEILPLAQYSLLKGVPLVHFFGGECDISYCFDTLVRDSVTKMAHIHFVSHKDIKRRIEFLGEESRRVFVIGNPSVSGININSYDKEIYSFLKDKNIEISSKIVNVCYHPVTTDRTSSKNELEQLLLALLEFKEYTYIWSGINNDPGYEDLKARILDFVKEEDNHYFFDNLGKNNYFSLLKNAKFMIGNSSSGLLEAASFNLPVINIGGRQSGRLHGHNVLDIKADNSEIKEGIKIVLKMQGNTQNPFVKSDGLQIVYDTLSSLDSFKNLKFKKLSLDSYELDRVPSEKD